jgi:hypothetical protein
MVNGSTQKRALGHATRLVRHWTFSVDLFVALAGIGRLLPYLSISPAVSRAISLPQLQQKWPYLVVNLSGIGQDGFSLVLTPA